MRKKLSTVLAAIMLLGVFLPVYQASAVEYTGPLKIVVTNDRHDGIKLTWENNPEVPSGRAVNIQYRLDGNTTWTKLTNVYPENEYLWDSADPGLNYEFLLGYCPGGDEAMECAKAWPYLTDPDPYPGTRILKTPAGFNATDGTNEDGIRLTWDSHPHDHLSGFIYQIWSKATPGDDYTLEASGSPAKFPSNSYLDVTMVQLATRYYKITVCRDSCSFGAFNTGFRGLLPPENLVITEEVRGVTLDWDQGLSGGDHYVVERSLTSPTSWSVIGSPTRSVFFDSTGTMNVEYLYRVKACSSDPSVCSTPISGRGLRGIYPPTLSSDPATGGIQLSWIHDNKGDTNIYRIFRKRVQDPWTKVILATQPAKAGQGYLDLGAVKDTEYNYRISACFETDTVTDCSDVSNTVTEVWRSCYPLSLSVVGSGATPSPDPAQSVGCPAGSESYTEGQLVEYLGAKAAMGWEFSHWTGTSAPSSSSLVMPASGRRVTLTYIKVCHPVSFDITGNGTAIVSSPTASAGCSVGEFVAGEVLSLLATPSSGWKLTSWGGTDDDRSTATTNSVAAAASTTNIKVVFETTDTPTIFTNGFESN